jgi:hypothetical protein
MKYLLTKFVQQNTGIIIIIRSLKVEIKYRMTVNIAVNMFPLVFLFASKFLKHTFAYFMWRYRYVFYLSRNLYPYLASSIVLTYTGSSLGASLGHGFSSQFLGRCPFSPLPTFHWLYSTGSRDFPEHRFSSTPSTSYCSLTRLPHSRPSPFLTLFPAPLPHSNSQFRRSSFLFVAG